MLSKQPWILIFGSALLVFSNACSETPKDEVKAEIPVSQAVPIFPAKANLDTLVDSLLQTLHPPKERRKYGLEKSLFSPDSQYVIFTITQLLDYYDNYWRIYIARLGKREIIFAPIKQRESEFQTGYPLIAAIFSEDGQKAFLVVGYRSMYAIVFELKTGIRLEEKEIVLETYWDETWEAMPDSIFRDFERRF